LTSVKHTSNNSNTQAIRRRKKKRSNLLPSIVVILLLLILASTIILVIKNNSISNYYAVDRLYSVYAKNLEENHLDTFACDLCIEGEATEHDDSFNSASALLADADGGELRFSKDAFKRLHPASTTKIMTCLLALKYGNLNDMVTLTNDVIITEQGASLAHVNPGDVLSLEQLLYALMLPSGNDAANAIAVHLGGSIEGFADIMNAEALKLGATGTHFTNANGITDEDHYSTAYDLYLIMHEALKYEKFREICSTTSFIADYYSASDGYVSKTWKNTNKYINGDEKAPDDVSIIAGKTGTTMAALSCPVLASEVDGKDSIEVILKAPRRDILYQDMRILLEKTVSSTSQ